MRYVSTFAERLDRARRFYEQGAEDIRVATAKGLTYLTVPAGYDRPDQAAYALGCAHQRRDTVTLRGNGPSDSLSAERSSKYRTTPAYAAWKAKRKRAP